MFWLVLSVLGAFSVSLAPLVMGHPVPVALAGMLIPLSAITVVWGTRNPSAMVTLMFVIPIAGKWLAWLSVGIVVFSMGQASPAMGALACIPLALSWAYADSRIPGMPYGKTNIRSRAAWKPSERDDRYFEEVRKREKDREERERLRRLFEGSLKDNPDDDLGSSSGR